MFAPNLTKKVHVVVSGNATSYNSAMTSALANTGKFTVGVQAAIAAVAALSSVMAGIAVKSAATFEHAMAKVKAISGSTAKEFKALEDEAKRLGKVTKFTMVQIAEGMESLARAGLTPIEVIKTMGGVAALAASQGLELSEAARMITFAVKGMGLSVADADKVANVFAATASSANLNVRELSEAFTIFAPLANVLGMSIEDVSGMIGALADVGLTGSKATTVLSTAMARLAAPPAKAAAMLKALNVEMWDSEGRFVGMVELVSQLENRFEGLTDQQQAAAVSAIFGQRAFKNWMSLINSGSDNLSTLIGEVSGTNAAFDQQAIMLDNASGAWTLLSSSINAVFEALGSPTLETIKNILLWIKGLVDSLLDKIRSLAPYIQAFFETLYLYVKKNREAFGYLIKQIMNMGKIILIIGLVATAMKMLLSPVLWLTLAAVAMYAAWKINLYGIRDIVTDLKDRFVEWFKSIDMAATWDSIKEKWTSFNEWLVNTGITIDNVVTSISSLWAVLGQIGNVAGTIVSAPIEFGLELFGEDGMAASVDSFFKTLPGKLLAVAGLGVLGKWMLGGLLASGGKLIAGSAIRLPLIAVAAHFGWSVFNIADTFKNEGFDAALGAAVPTVGGILGAILGTIVGGPIGTVVGYTVGTLLGHGINFVVKVAAEYIWDIKNRVGSVDNLMEDYPIQNPSFTAGGGSGVVEVPALVMFDIQGFMIEQAEAAAGNGYIPGTYTPVGKALGGMVGGSGVGDIIPAMLEPGEFVVPNWMMDIPEVAKLITGIWSGGPRMATGGYAGGSDSLTSGGAGVVQVAVVSVADAAVPSGPGIGGVFDNILSGTDAIYEWLLPRSEDKAALDEMFGAFRSIVVTSSELTTGFQEQLTAALAAVDASGLEIDTLNEEADARAEAIDGLLDLAGTASETASLVASGLGAAKALLSQLEGNLGLFSTAMVDILSEMQNEQMDFSNVMSIIANLILGVIKNLIADLEAQKEELLRTLDLYVSSLNKVASSMNSLFGMMGPLGRMMDAGVNAFISSIGMLTLSGLELLNAGINMTVTLLNSLVQVFTGLIQSGEAYSAVQEQGSRVWDAIGDLLGQFVWPLAALIKQLADWLGIQSDVNDAATEVGVPAMFKRERRAWESASPGDTSYSGGSGVEIPAWATELVVGIGNKIQELFESWGITNWEELMAAAKDAAIDLWNFIDKKLPEWITWFQETLWPGIQEFGNELWKNIKAIWDWLINQDWSKIWEDIKTKFEEFRRELGNLIDLGKISDEVARIVSAIDSLKNTLKWVIAIAAGAIIGGVGGALAPLTFGLSIAGAALGAIAGAAIGAVIAGIFHDGGVVPGPIGSPQLILAEGGEEVITYADRGKSNGQTVVYTNVDVYLNGNEVGNLVIEDIRNRSRSMTGNRSSTSALSRRR